MFIFAFVIIVALVQFFSIKALKISISNNLSYSYSKRDSFIVVGFFIVALGLQFLPFKGNLFWILLGIYSAALLMTNVVLTTIKKTIILKQKEELQKIFEVLEPVFPKNTEFDPNNPPFKLEYDGPNVNRITISINPNTFKEAVAVGLCMSLNKYLPNYEWMNEFDFAARECAFVGTPLPPFIAKYKGSWLRPTEFIPLGLSGIGEVSWTINSIKNDGRSNYVYEDGKIAKTSESPSAPQALCVGSPLSLDTVIPTTNGPKTMETIKVGDIVYSLNNKEAKVIEVHEIHMPAVLYRLTFRSKDKLKHRNNQIDIKSDAIHKWPVKTEKGIRLTKTNDLMIGDIVIGQDCDYEVSAITTAPPEYVRCIKVDDESHLFLVGNYENGPFIYTKNTGGQIPAC